MPDSDNVFESGDPISVGQHGQNDLLYASGEPVSDTGFSPLVFERGVGLGPVSFEWTLNATLHAPDGSQLAEISLDQDIQYSDGGIGFSINGSFGGSQGDPDLYYDYWVYLDDEGNPDDVVESFENTDLSGYDGSTGNFNVTTDDAKEGTHSLEAWSDRRERIYNMNPPEAPFRGQPFRVHWKVQLLADFGNPSGFDFALQNADGDGYSVAIDATSPSRFVVGELIDGNFSGEYEEVDAPVGDYVGEWLYADVYWV